MNQAAHQSAHEAPSQYATTEGRLPLEENRRIFRDQIAPAFLDDCAPQRTPVAVIVAGQTGAGKTAVTRMVKDALDRGGPAAWINMDFYNPLHPGYARWQAERPQEADALVRPDGDRWWEQAQDHALSRGYNILLESAMVTPAEYEDICRRIRSAQLPEGVAPYRIETAFVAVPGPVSRLGIMSRYLDELQRHGHGRLVDPAIHDAALRGVLRGATALEREREGLGDFASVMRRGAETVHMQHITPGEDRTSLVTAIEREHNRVQTTAEASQFAARHAAAVLTAPEFALPELAHIARSATPLLPLPHTPWHDVSARAAALRTAEPPRVADPTLFPRTNAEVTDLLAHTLAAHHTALSQGNGNTTALQARTTERLLGELARRAALTPEQRAAEETRRRSATHGPTQPAATLPAQATAAAARSRSTTVPQLQLPAGGTRAAGAPGAQPRPAVGPEPPNRTTRGR